MRLRGRAGGVHDGDLRRMPAARIEYDVVDELALGIVVEAGAKTFALLCHDACAEV